MRLTVVIQIGALGLLSAPAFAARVWQLPIGHESSSHASNSFQQMTRAVAGGSLSLGARVTPSTASGSSDDAGAYQIAAPVGAISGGTGSITAQDFDSAPRTLALGSIPAPMPSYGPGSVGSHDASPTSSGDSDTKWNIVGPLHPGLGKSVGIEDVAVTRLVEVNPVPVPTPMMLAGFGLMAMAGVRASARRRA